MEFTMKQIDRFYEQKKICQEDGSESEEELVTAIQRKQVERRRRYEKRRSHLEKKGSYYELKKKVQKEFKRLRKNINVDKNGKLKHKLKYIPDYIKTARSFDPREYDIQSKVHKNLVLIF